MATAADVPGRYDFVINGKGYMSPDTEDTKAIYGNRASKATYGYTASFVERQNTQGDYGDNFQDFWLTSRQRDWTLGEQQRFFRVNDEDKARRYWQGSNVDVTVPGQVSMRQATFAPTFAAAVTAVGNGKFDGGIGMWVSTATNLYDVTESAVTGWGAHGLGTSPQTIVSEGNASTSTFLSGTGAGTVGVRKLSSAAVWSTFSATAADALTYLNNTLYGFRDLTSDLIRYDSAGAITSLASWKGADGTAFSGAVGSKLVPYGPDLLIFRSGSNDRAAWVYDGGGVRKLCDLPFNFYGTDVAVVSGIVFFAGYLTASGGNYPAIYFYANGSIGLLWKADSTSSTTGIVMTPFAEGLAFIDDSTPQSIFWFNPAAGGVSRIASWASAAGTRAMASGFNSFLLTQSGTTGVFYPSTTGATTATVTHSLMDFDSSLTKTFGGIKVKFDAGSGGNGGSVDIAYRLNDLSGSYTTLQTSAVSGTEYKLTNISGDAISVKITLNKGTSTNGPVLKRVSVRASVKQTPSFRKDTFLIQCTGRDGVNPMTLRDGTMESRDGLDLATELRAVASAGTAVSITDEFGTFTGVIENDNFVIARIRANEFLASVPVREV